jgi:ArsR family transcriptional regulator
MDEAIVVRSLAALAQPVRLQVFRALVIAGPGGMTPSTMADGLGIPGSSLSFHLKELVNAGLVSSERASRNLIYRAEFGRMNAVLQYLTRHCCEVTGCGSDGTQCRPNC